MGTFYVQELHLYVACSLPSVVLSCAEFLPSYILSFNLILTAIQRGGIHRIHFIEGKPKGQWSSMPKVMLLEMTKLEFKPKLFNA